MTDLNPDHYRDTKIEAIDIIEDRFADNYNLGAALKYLLRLGKKDNETVEVGKTIWYLLRHLKRTGQDLPDLAELATTFAQDSSSLEDAIQSPVLQGLDILWQKDLFAFGSRPLLDKNGSETDESYEVDRVDDGVLSSDEPFLDISPVPRNSDLSEIKGAWAELMAKSR